MQTSNVNVKCRFNKTSKLYNNFTGQDLQRSRAEKQKLNHKLVKVVNYLQFDAHSSSETGLRHVSFPSDLVIVLFQQEYFRRPDLNSTLLYKSTR
jgi:hypothetical protein